MAKPKPLHGPPYRSLPAWRYVGIVDRGAGPAVVLHFRNKYGGYFQAFNRRAVSERIRGDRQQHLDDRADRKLLKKINHATQQQRRGHHYPAFLEIESRI